jgi:uncharacterized protein YyaL (SSP411 family)
MIRRLLMLLLLAPWAAQAALQNALASHPSPYLAMHGQDPVHWQEWGAQALQRARQENKLLFVSSGYFACHWCHVMQRESYADAAVAALLNQYFIPVKIDRELLPALDAYLIDFVQATRGSAGWPLNVFITPQGYPLLGLTYAPRHTFQRLLSRLSGAWRAEGEKLSAMAAAAAAQGAAETPAAAVLPDDVASLLEQMKQQALRLGDELQGGFGRQSRFPMAPQLQVLLELQALRPDPLLEDFLRLTLRQMASRGMRDQLAGGFFRYTVDPDWQVPHFEKMLYNQALQTMLYWRAAQVLQEPAFKQVAKQTLDFVLTHMHRGQGHLLASLSALDDKGEEGGAYLWSAQQLEAVLDADELQLIEVIWGMRGSPNNEGGYLPVRMMTLAAAAAQLDWPLPRASAVFDRARAKLLLARGARGLPSDDKPIAAWSGLMLSALVVGAREWGADYQQPARELSGFLSQRLWDGRQLQRSFSSRGWLGEAALEDYTLVARGLADWAAWSGDGAARALARRLVGDAWQRFFQQGWRQTPSPLLPHVPLALALPDSPLPAPPPVLIALTRELAADDAALLQQADTALALSYPLVASAPFSYASSVWALWLAQQSRRPPAL